MQKTSQYMQQIRALLHGYRSTCPYCGATTISIAQNASICNFCEAYLPEYISKNDSNTTKMSLLNESAAAGDSAAIDTYVASIKNNKPDPMVFYGIANLYLAAASFKYSNMNYALEGFMEPNSANMYASLAITSKAKEYFFKTIGMVSMGEEYSANPQVLLASFMSNVKLRRLTQANIVLSKINFMRNVDLPESYANMVYMVATKNKEASKYLGPMLNSAVPTAFYYLSIYLWGNKQTRDAEAMLYEISTYMSMPLAFEALKQMQWLKEKTTL